MSVAFNKSAPNNVALIGTDVITLITLSKDGKIADSKIMNFNADSDFILRARWLPGQKVRKKSKPIIRVLFSSSYDIVFSRWETS